MTDFLGSIGADIELGGADDDTFRMQGGADSVYGGDGDDLIEGQGGDDVLHGNADSDRIFGGSGNDILVGDDDPEEGALQTDTDSTTLVNENPVTVSLTGPEMTGEDSATFTGFIGQSVPTSAINVSFVVDVSGSMSDSFGGTTVGDVNGDGYSNTRLDAAIVAFEELAQAIADAGYPDAEVNLVAFESDSYPQGTFSLSQDSDSDGTTDLVEALRALQFGGGTNFEAPLQDAASFFSGQPSGEGNYLYFLSDGFPNEGGAITDDLATLNGYGVVRSAIGVGTGASTTDLNPISSDGTAEIVLDPTALGAAIIAPPVSATAVNEVQIRVNGILVQTIAGAALVSSPLGLTYAVDLPLVPGAEDLVTATVVFADGTELINELTVGEPAIGDDLLDGGSGSDLLQGGGGDDTLRGSSGTDSLEGGRGEDMLYGGSAADLLEGGKGDDLIRGGSGRDTATYVHSDRAVVADLAAKTADAGGDAGDGEDRLYSIENLDGSLFDDALSGGRGANRLFGDEGHDTLDGRGGDDTLLGGEGNDVLIAGDGEDGLSGGAGDDSFFVAGAAASGAVTVEDTAGLDTIDLAGATGGAVIDLVTGGTVAGRTVIISGGSTTVSPLDVMFAQDLSGSFGDDLPNVQAQLAAVVAAVRATQPDTLFGISSFVDIPLSPFGSTGDFVYNTDLALTADTALLASIYAGFGILSGNDGPEAQLTALLQLAQRGAEVGWRADATRVVVLFTDASYHLAGDSTLPGNDGDGVLDGTPPGTGEDYPALAQVQAALAAAGILPIFAVTDGASSTYQSLVDDFGFGAVVELASDSSNLSEAIAAALEVIANSTVIENLLGTGFADRLGGNDAANLIDGRAGADTMTGGLGDDIYVVDDAGDVVVETADAGAGRDTIRTALAAFSLAALPDVEDLEGTATTGQALTGNAAGNLITSGLGNDTMTGGGGVDTLRGGQGDDRYQFFFASSGEDRVSEAGGGGGDTVAVLDRAATTLLYRRSGTDLIIEEPGNAAKLVVQGLYSGAAADRLEYLETIDGTRLIKTNLTGTSSAELFVGTSAAETILAGGGDDIVAGGGGNDTMGGGAGVDRLLGGAGDDRYEFSFATDAEDRISEVLGGGADTLALLDRSAFALLYRRSGTDLIIEAIGSTAKVVVQGLYNGIATERVEFLTATDGTRYLKTTLAGTSTDDILVGASGGEAITGGGGSDIIAGGGGGDTMGGGAGVDRLLGGAGDDRYEFAFATDGQDRISEVLGGGGDTLAVLDRTAGELSFTRVGTDLLIGQAGSTAQVLVEGLFNGVAAERVEFLETTDGIRVLKTAVTAGTGTDDIVVGTVADETLQGGDGSDVLVGAGGKDRQEGGAGADVFLFTQIADSGTASAARDTIMDFAQGSDVISLAGMDANSLLAGDQAFVFRGTLAHAGAGSLRYSLIGGNTLVEADVNGDGSSDFAILLAGSISLAGSDFVL